MKVLPVVHSCREANLGILHLICKQLLAAHAVTWMPSLLGYEVN
jgi:hypothetical protein